MTTVTMINNAPLHFGKFDIQRCIRIVTEDGEHMKPVDPRQREDILASVAGVDYLSGEDYARLSLIEIELNGVFTAALDSVGGELYETAVCAAPEDHTYILSEGSYGGVYWRVVGYLSDKPKEPMQLCASNDEDRMRTAHAAFTLLLEAYQGAVAAQIPAVDDMSQQVLTQLKALHPELFWALFPLGDYDQYAEIDAPDTLVCFGRDESELDEGLVDPYSTMLGTACEPSHWGVSVEAAQIIQRYNRVFVAKYSACDGPKYLASLG